MADTGPPWNLRFPTAQDFVRETNFYIEDLAEDVAAGLTAAGNPGIGSNVVQTVKTDTFTSTSTSFVTVDGLTVTITPTSETSKILLVAQISTSNAANGSVYKITGGNAAAYVGDTAGSRLRAVFGGFGTAGNSSLIFSQTIVFLDAPNTTAATTYAVEARGTDSSPNVFVNRGSDDADAGTRARGASSITAIEVAA